MTLDSKATLRDSKDIKAKLKIESCSRGSFIVAVVIDTEDISRNTIRHIPCKRGTHISSVVYDATQDSYCVECHDFILIGDIPHSYVMCMEGVAAWETFTPLPEVVIKRYLSEEIKERLETWKSKFQDPKYQIRFIQMIKVY